MGVCDVTWVNHRGFRLFMILIVENMHFFECQSIGIDAEKAKFSVYGLGFGKGIVPVALHECFLKNSVT